VSSKKMGLAKRLIKNGNFCCPLCGRRMTLLTCNIDHIVPISKGGSGKDNNLQLVHIACNLRKGNSMPPYHGIKFTGAYKKTPKRTPAQQRKEKIFERAAANGNEDARAIKKRMDIYYSLVDAKYEAIHPLPL